MEHVIPHWHFSLYKWFKMEAKIWMTVETWGYMEHVISHWNVSLEHKCFKMEAKIWMAVETWDCMERVIPHWNFSLYKWFKMEAQDLNGSGNLGLYGTCNPSVIILYIILQNKIIQTLHWLVIMEHVIPQS